MIPAAPASIVALLLASFLGLSLQVLGAREAKVELALVLVGLASAGFGAAAAADVLFDLGAYPWGPALTGAALASFAAVRAARSR